ncbi:MULTISPECIES: hypothetical protein [Mesobacillus]|uniref:CBM20 domain-containing protein n=1 Tax=Mesobacillus stamsii TaxID=225347 RepID=A0ABU0G0L3_9BACI|nr:MULTISPECIES: hypothetical protein [Mesobacillus]MDQ0415465.1 hypothetical protein [Mesobacillus stamsii]
MILVPGQVNNYTPLAPTITKVRVHYDVGYGNNMYIRGNSYPFWWDKGRKMRNISSDVWEYEMERIPSGVTVEFKPLINDTTWSTGNNFTVTGGQTLDIYPNF